LREFEDEAQTASCSSRIQYFISSIYNGAFTSHIISDVSECSPMSNVSKVFTSDSSSQTPLHLTNETPRKMKLLNKIRTKNQEIKHLKKQINTSTQKLTQVLKLCKKYLPPSLNLIIDTYFKHKYKKATGYRCCNEFKQLALTIFIF